MEGATSIGVTWPLLFAAVLALGSGETVLYDGSKVTHQPRHPDGHCDRVEKTCTVSNAGLLTIPCGSLDPKEESVSFTYQLQNGTVLDHEPSEFLTFNASRTAHNGLVVCCNTNASIYSVCYRINVTYPPVRVPLMWSEGYSSHPIFKLPYKLTCPLEGNPPATYRWERYTVDLSEQLELPDNLHFEFNDSGRSWEVDELEEKHNGVYMCYASNSLGTAKYWSIANFWIHVSECDDLAEYIRPDLVHVEISPYENADKQPTYHYPEGSTVLINCSMSPTLYEYPPYWYRSINCSSGRMVALDAIPNYSVERYQSLEECGWISVLNISNFTEDLAGLYYCGNCEYTFGSQLLSVEGIATPEDLSVLDPKNSTRLIVTLTVSCLVFIIVTCLLVSVSVVIVRRRLSVSYTATEEPPVQGFSYDVFISVHDEASDIAQEKILNPLEEECNPPYKVCWHHRDFIAGLPITEQIAEAVQTSRKVVFIFSEHFAQSKFCCLELEHTLHRLLMTRTRCLIPITLSEKVVPRELKRRITYWPVVNALEEDLTEKLTKLIGQPIGAEAEAASEDVNTCTPLIPRGSENRGQEGSP